MIILGKLHFDPVQQNLKVFLGRKVNVLNHFIIKVMTVFPLKWGVQNCWCVCNENKVNWGLHTLFYTQVYLFIYPIVKVDSTKYLLCLKILINLWTIILCNTHLTFLHVIHNSTWLKNHFSKCCFSLLVY